MIEKTCNKCNLNKSITKFWKSKTCKDGFRNKCLDCYALDKKLYREKNKEILSIKKSFYYYKNKELIKTKIKKPDTLTKKKASAKYWLKNKTKLQEKSINYKKNNPEKATAWSAKRRAQQRKAYPKWLSSEEKKQITEFYKIAKVKTKEDNQIYHVDHIIPLNNKNVCGLHVPWNLQILSEKDNLHKGNSYEQYD